MTPHDTHGEGYGPPESSADAALRRWPVALVLLLLAILVVAAIVNVSGRPLGTVSQWLHDYQRVLEVTVTRLVLAAVWVGVSLALGLALAAAVRRRGTPHAAPGNLLFVVIAGALVVSQLALFEWDLTTWMLGPTVAVVVGVAIGAIGQRGRVGCVVAALLLAAVIGGPAWWAYNAYHLALADTPRLAPDNRVNADAKRRLIDKLEAARAASEATGRVALMLSPSEVELLVNWAMQIAGIPRAAAEVRPVGDGWFDVAATAAAPQRGWANIQARCRLVHQPQTFAIDVADLTIGQVRPPGLLMGRLVAWFNGKLAEDPTIGRLAGAVERFEVTAAHVRLAYKPEALPDDLLERVTGRPADSTIDGVAARYATELNRVAQGFDVKQTRDTLTPLVRAAFDLAALRTSAGGDPRRENRAAVYALATLLADRRVQQLYGRIADDDAHIFRQYWIPNRARLHDRVDLNRHYWISALIAMAANTQVSDLLGELKEQIDAGDGGSGFSFRDLLADRAGTRLGEMAVRDPAAARLIQRRLAQLGGPDQLIPEGDDLPEGLTAERLRSEYGGVNGPGYRRLVDEIERRVERLPLLQPMPTP